MLILWQPGLDHIGARPQECPDGKFDSPDNTYDHTETSRKKTAHPEQMSHKRQSRGKGNRGSERGGGNSGEQPVGQGRDGF